MKVVHSEKVDKGDAIKRITELAKSAGPNCSAVVELGNDVTSGVAEVKVIDHSPSNVSGMEQYKRMAGDVTVPILRNVLNGLPDNARATINITNNIVVEVE